ncbi:hypothetical protein PV04_09026 [Phialophora macrospora]|uniref:Zn(2)-C6 fungal-type domain-containing protein n=1 Tax=Phialophora macrospora TaxID=1851006 RepID=A0A0D2DPD4_9EURO|nr:hypothetical protein PV04_09026 [Phialophora macrospora]
MAESTALPRATSNEPVWPKKRPHPSTDQAVNGQQQPRGPVDYPRKRALVACEVCRLRKTKCDAARPQCSFCAGLDLECVYRRLGPGSGSDQTRRAKSHPRAVLSPGQEPHALSGHKRGLVSELREPLEFGDQELERPIRCQSAVADSRRGAVPASSPDYARSVRDQYPVSVESQLLHTSPTAATISSAYAVSEAADVPSFIGLGLEGLSRLAGRSTPPQLRPFLWDDAEEYFDREVQLYNLLLGPESAPDLSGLDFSFRTCWRYHQAFVRDILSWFPLLDLQYCAQIVQTTSEKGFDQSQPISILVLLILALGALTRSDDGPSSKANSNPSGIEYFRAACHLLSKSRGGTSTIIGAQSYILKSFYLLLRCRNLAAFDAVHTASVTITRLLCLRTRLATDAAFSDSCNRAYWICYIVEHELKPFIHYGTEMLQPFQEHLSLPLYRSHETSCFWLLSEIALRRIYLNGLGGTGRLGQTTYAPIVAAELTSQLERWHAHLHPSVKFSGIEPQLDLQKAFLQAQFYAAHCQVNWTYVLRILTVPPTDWESDETIAMMNAAEQAIQYAMLHLRSLEGLLQDRHLMLFANQVSCFAFSLMLLCTVDHPHLRRCQHPPRSIAAAERARNLLNMWAENDGNVADMVRRLDDLLVQKKTSLDL